MRYQLLRQGTLQLIPQLLAAMQLRQFSLHPFPACDECLNEADRFASTSESSDPRVRGLLFASRVRNFGANRRNLRLNSAGSTGSPQPIPFRFRSSQVRGNRIRICAEGRLLHSQCQISVLIDGKPKTLNVPARLVEQVRLQIEMRRRHYLQRKPAAVSLLRHERSHADSQPASDRRRV